jgi:deoxyribonuclease-4
MRMGRHMPGGSKPETLRRAQEIGCDAVQVFLTNPRGWQTSEPNPADCAAFSAAAQTYDQRPVVVHAAYIINLASPREDFFEKSIALLRTTMLRAQQVGAASVVFHIGSHSGSGEEAGIARLVAGLHRVMEGAPEGVQLLLENDTGGGGKLGYRFENLAAVLEQLPAYDGQLGVCLDTAHLWGAGFDVGTAEGVEQTLAEADRVLGLRRVPVLHVNDSRGVFGGHRDIHARLGEGTIPVEGLTAFLRHPALAHTAALLETPLPELQAGTIDWARERAYMLQARAFADIPLPIAAGDGE